MGADFSEDIAPRYKVRNNLNHHFKLGVFFLVLSWLIWIFLGDQPRFLAFWMGTVDYEGGWFYHNVLTIVEITGFLGGLNLGRGMLNVWEKIGIYNSKKTTIQEMNDHIAWRVIIVVILITITWFNRDLNPISLSNEYVFMLFSAIFIGHVFDELIESKEVAETSEQE